MFPLRFARFGLGFLLGALLCSPYLMAACNDTGNTWITRNLASGIAADDTCWTLFQYTSCGPEWRSSRGHIVRGVCGTSEAPNQYYVMFANQVVYSRYVDTANPNWAWGLPCPLFFMATGDPNFIALYGEYRNMMHPIDQYPRDCIADDQAAAAPPPKFDTDLDGIYDDVDTDDDGDGVPDTCDMGPRNKNDKRKDCDGDGNEDAPDPGDPGDPNGDFGDCDGDGQLNKYDEDDDGDGCPDKWDPDRCNAQSTCDCDKDGKLDFNDDDDDNDGCPDEEDSAPCDPAVRCNSADSGECDGERRLKAFRDRVYADLGVFFASSWAVDGQAPRVYTFTYPMPGGGNGQIHMDSNFTVEGAALFGVTMNQFRLILRTVLICFVYIKFNVAVIKTFQVL